ncbi:MAG: hypothetical protein U9R49_10010, partial [Bacteroidota bacterium]|nr:hypothetical protein [Bacteroidota bacterium]
MMKLLLHRFILPLLLLLLITGCDKDDPPVMVEIPDEAFLNALIELGVDTNGDGEICQCEAEEIIALDVSGKDITDMTGIEVFVNLDSLICHNNQLSSLDVSGNTLLVHLRCDGNQLTILEL